MTDDTLTLYHCCLCYVACKQALRCTRCNSRYYCSSRCMRFDYRRHRDHCKLIAKLGRRARPFNIDEMTTQQCLSALFDIVRRCAISGPDLDPFDAKRQSGEFYITARAIGERLNALGLDSTLMAAAHDMLILRLPGLAPAITTADQIRSSDSLALAWQGIGDWRIRVN